MPDFSDLDRLAAKDLNGLLWHVGERWTFTGCRSARNGYGRLCPVEGVAEGRVTAALRSGAFVGVHRDGMTVGRPIVAVRRARPDDSLALMELSRAEA